MKDRKGKGARARQRARDAAMWKALNSNQHRVVNIEPPTDEMIAERDARLAHPQTLTAVLMGDPPRGQSALDRRQA